MPDSTVSDQQPGASGDPIDEFIEASFAELQKKSAAQSAQWRLAECEYSVSLDQGVITFGLDGHYASAPIQVIGTYNTRDKSFMWAWDHPSIPVKLQQAALLVKSWGERFQKQILLEHKVSVEELMPWYFTALAVRLASMQGAYRAVFGPTFVFMAIGEIKLVDAPAR